MKKLTPDELSLIAGSTVVTSDEETTFPPMVVTGNPPPPSPPNVWIPPSPPSPPSPPGVGGPPAPPPAPPRNPNCDAPVDSIDHGVISELEGGQRLDGHVPPGDDGGPHPNSGVTIATGFDLAGRSQAAFNELGITDQGLIDRMLPFTTQRGADAAAVANQLVITEAEATHIDQAVRGYTYDRLVARYNQDAAFSDFQNLPGNTQTVIMSIAHQYSVETLVTHNFWTQITTGDWQAAYNNLMDYQDQTPTRRKTEAALLLEDINAYTMPTPQNPC